MIVLFLLVLIFSGNIVDELSGVEPGLLVTPSSNYHPANNQKQIKSEHHHKQFQQDLFELDDYFVKAEILSDDYEDANDDFLDDSFEDKDFVLPEKSSSAGKKVKVENGEAGSKKGLDSIKHYCEECDTSFKSKSALLYHRKVV